MASKIELDSVTKIFGETPKGPPMQLLRSGGSKDEILMQTGHVLGLNDVTFKVNEGEIFVVMGLSGSGKSTAIRTINKLIEPTTGSVQIDGVEVTELTGKALQDIRREKMGMVFQHFALFPHRTVRDNTGYGLKVKGEPEDVRNQAADEALALVGLEGWGDSYPHELSGGMQQRVGLARALASDPEILLMDEAFSALDPLIRREMQDELMLLQARLKKTIVFITHDLNEALRVGDQVCIMKDGAVMQIGTPEEIITEPADPYVAEFIQDVDQGRVLQVDSVMTEPQPLRLDSDTVSSAAGRLTSQIGAALFVVDGAGKPVGVITADDAARAAQMGTSDLNQAMRKDFPTTSVEATLAEIYEMCGPGMPLAVIDGAGTLVGHVDPLHVLVELGKIEGIADRIFAEGYSR